MKRYISALVILSIVVACKDDDNLEFIPEIQASAEIYSINQVRDNQYTVSDQIIGTAIFGQSNNEVVQLIISLEGMSPNTSSAVHIHNGSVEEPGLHWNQGYLFAACDSLSLGERWNKPFIGDVGNVEIGNDGTGKFILRTDLWKINSGDRNDVLNKVIVIHENPEDFANECTPNHDHNHTNTKIAAGLIKLISGVSESSIKKGNGLRVESRQLPDFLICK